MSVCAAQRPTYWAEDPQGAGYFRGAADAPGPESTVLQEICQVRLVRTVRRRRHAPVLLHHRGESFISGFKQ